MSSIPQGCPVCEFLKTSGDDSPCNRCKWDGERNVLTEFRARLPADKIDRVDRIDGKKAGPVAGGTINTSTEGART